MSEIPPCPQCKSTYAYLDRDVFNCPECGHEWSESAQEDTAVVRCSNGNVLQSGDSVTVIRDLKIKGSSNTIKVGTKVKNIRVLEPEYVADGVKKN